MRLIQKFSLMDGNLDLLSLIVKEMKDKMIYTTQDLVHLVIFLYVF